MRKLVAGIVTVASLVIVAPAAAITNGQPDGNGHPEVGALLAQQAFSDGTWAECSGTLVGRESSSPRRTAMKASATSTSPSTPPTSIRRARPSQGHGMPIRPSARRRATRTTSRSWSSTTRSRSRRQDLPAANSLAGLGKNQKFTSVGYGAQAVSSGKGGKTFSYSDVRFVASGTLNAVTPSFLRISQNASTGNGGTCYGDSGGPNFLGAGSGRQTSSPERRSPVTRRAGRPTSITGSIRLRPGPSWRPTSRFRSSGLERGREAPDRVEIEAIKHPLTLRKYGQLPTRRLGS